MSLRPPTTPRASSIGTPSGIATPSSGLPTPSTRRRASAAHPTGGLTRSTSGHSTEHDDGGNNNNDDGEAAAAMASFKQAMQSNDPARYSDSPTPDSIMINAKRGGGGLRRPSNINLRSSAATPSSSTSANASSMRPVTPNGFGGARSISRLSMSSSNARNAAETPSRTFSRSKTPTFGTALGSSTTMSRPLSRSSNQGNPSLANSTRGFQLGDQVRFEVAGVPMEGVTRFLGQVDGKAGQWAGVELDSEWSGQGKNDGSVKGVQYFACPPLCGLFIPLAKIAKKSPPPPIITAGSRASKYVGLNASELTTNKRAAAMGPPASPTKVGGPRRSIVPPSPEKVGGGTNLASASSTPRAIRTARPSIGIASATPRKSIGGGGGGGGGGGFSNSHATPRASMGGSSSVNLGGSVKRLASSSSASSSSSSTLKTSHHRSQQNIPDVPALPHSYTLGTRSITPSSGRDHHGRVTPSTPSFNRRTSEIGPGGGGGVLSHSSHSHSSRPTTPSLRSFSRQSLTASSLHSRPSSNRSSVMSTTTRDEDDLAEFKQQALEAREREDEVRRLLQGSERLGRELEDRVAQLQDQLNEEKQRQRKKEEEEVLLIEEQKRLRGEHDEVNERHNDDEEMVVAKDEEGRGKGEQQQEQQVDEEELERLKQTVKEMKGEEEKKQVAMDRLQREWATKFKAKEGEIDSLRERLDRATNDVDQEKHELQKQLEQLRNAGQALCETYEERIAEIEIARLESVDLAETLASRLETLQLGGGGGGGRAGSRMEQGILTNDDHPHHERSDSPISPTRRLGVSQNASAADMINAESAQADLEHLRTKVESLTEQLEEARMHLEAEIEDAKKRRTKYQETEAVLKKEIKTLREGLDRGTKNEARLTARIAELEDALQESQATLEEERSELEGLRSDVVGGANASIADELKRANKLVATLKKDLEQAKSELNLQDGTVQELKIQLDQAHSLVALQRSSSPAQVPTQDTHSTPGSTSLRISSSSSSSNGLPIIPNPRRESLASLGGGSNSGGGRRSLNGGATAEELSSTAAAAKEQIVGLKVIIKHLEDDNAILNERNTTLLEETKELKHSQQVLEATVENLMTEVKHGDQRNGSRVGDGAASAVSTSPSFEKKGLQAIKEVEDLKSKLRDVEKKAEREIKVLHQEVNELEALVESKIYREDELSTELEKYKALASKSATLNSYAAKSSSISSSSSSRPHTTHNLVHEGADDDDDDDEEDNCEMCGEKHDLDSCPIFAGTSNVSPSKKPRASSSNASAPTTTTTTTTSVAATNRTMSDAEAYCDDCEEYGHDLDDCPLANDIF